MSVIYVLTPPLPPPSPFHYHQRTFKTQKEAAWTLCNMTAAGKIEHIAYLIQCHAIPPMCDMLDCKDTQVTEEE